MMEVRYLIVKINLKKQFAKHEYCQLALGLSVPLLFSVASILSATFLTGLALLLALLRVATSFNKLCIFDCMLVHFAS